MFSARWFVAVVALGPFLLPSAASAQSEQRPMYELPSLSITTISDATPLNEDARALYEQGKWSEAARMYEAAAEELPRNDAASYDSYDMAARMYFYGRNFGKADAMMTRAADVAEATGDIVSAADRHVDAAFIAVWEGYPGRRRGHVAKAEELAGRDGFGAQNAARLSALIRGVSALPIEEADGS
jgi:tetratricopeptide (TPR) repeat protein